MLPNSVIKALANERRLAVLNWLKDPRAHFPHRQDQAGVPVRLVGA